jgi:hypothetical protein
MNLPNSSAIEAEFIQKRGKEKIKNNMQEALRSCFAIGYGHVFPLLPIAFSALPRS